MPSASALHPSPDTSMPGAPPPEPPDEHRALRARLDAARAESLAAFRAPPQVRCVGHNELTAINADLEAVRAINAPLPHNLRSARVAAWPVPVFRATVLHSWRDLYDALAAADRVLGAAEAHRNSWMARHG